MKINQFPYNNTDKKPSYQQSFKSIPPNPKYIPEFIGKIGKVAGEYVSMPEQKLFLATTALMLTPLIDLKFAQEDQKVDSAIKSASKAMAGGFTGVAIRAGFLKLTDHFIGLDKHNKLNLYFLPESAVILSRREPEMAKLQMRQYNKSLGTLFAVLFMILFSNSKVDVPLTSDLQDLISGVVKENKTWLKSFSDVYDSRSKKIKDWFERKKQILNSIKTKLIKIIKIIAEDTSASENNPVSQPTADSSSPSRCSPFQNATQKNSLTPTAYREFFLGHLKKENKR